MISGHPRDAFSGPYEFLSNFFPSPIRYQGVLFATVEHGYQAMKTVDPRERARIQRAPDPGIAKMIGKNSRLTTMRPDWDDIKVKVMRELLLLKFVPGTELAMKLLATGNEPLVEINCWHDNIWGVCMCRQCPGTGTNHLGRLLVDIRTLLQAGSTEQKFL